MSDLPVIALVGAGYVATLPLMTLGILCVRKPVNTVTAVSVSVGWLLFLALWRAIKPYRYYGEFPLRMLYRDFVQPLPVALAVGLAFGVAARRMLRSQRGSVGTP
jgi:hypothetical protein